MKTLVLTLLCLAISGTAVGETSADEWQFQLTPYIWLPTIDGTLNYGPPPGSGGSPDVEIGPTDWLELLNFGVLMSGSARKGRFSMFTDVLYLSMTKNGDGRVVSVDGTVSGPGGSVSIPVSADLTLNTRTDFDGLVWTFAAAYTVKQTDASSLDIFAGARLFSVDFSTRWDLTAAITTPGGVELLAAQGGVGSDTDLWDAIVGVRGHVGLGNGKWSVPYYLDIGTGSSDLTWSAMTGLTRSVGWGEILFVYRHLEYDEDFDGLMQNFSFSGPAVGASFRF
ncbi:MAG: hypothetical protein IIB77_14550 [Proteobacteria bacterium]|nr:hypothetical protein [Pseudomonadota bacterium]